MSPSSRVDYALQALVALAAEPAGLKSEEISAPAGLSQRYLQRVLNELRVAGFVHSKRGGAGGYWLAHPASDITVADVLRLLARPSTDAHDDPLEWVWATIEEARLSAAATITLADLAETTTRRSRGAAIAAVPAS
jgi:Rrf2 family protein